MKRLLAVTVLLSSAMCIDTVPGNRPEPSLERDTGTQVPRDKIRLGETDFVGQGTSIERFSLPFLATARRSREVARESWQNSSKSKPSYPRCQNINPTIIVSVNVREPFAKKDELGEKYAYYREQGWKMENPMYVEEPGWIEIENNYAKGKLPFRLESIDPYVLSRGKRIRWLNNDTKHRYSRQKTNFYPLYSRWMRSNDPNRFSTRHLRATRVKTKRDSMTAKESLTRKDRILERRNHLAILDLLEQPYIISRGKKASLLKEQVKKSKTRLSWGDREDRDISNEVALLSERRGSLLNRLLTTSDFFHANRGKRIPSKIMESMVLNRFEPIPRELDTF